MFPDDLPGMPPERAIEFKIELQPGTTPIAKGPVQDVTGGNEGIEDSIARFVGQRIYPPKYIALGLLSTVCGEERQRATIMCGLSTAKCSHHQEQVSIPTH
jgi:hypothetical protein